MFIVFHLPAYVFFVLVLYYFINYSLVIWFKIYQE